MAKITTAKITHRDYVPYGWIALEFCQVEFYGYRAKELERKWDGIKNVRYTNYNALVKKNKSTIANLKDEATAIYDSIKNSKPFFRFWYNPSEKQLLKSADSIQKKIQYLEEETEKIGKKRWFSTYECRYKIEHLLKENEFVIANSIANGEECVIFGF